MIIHIVITQLIIIQVMWLRQRIMNKIKMRNQMIALMISRLYPWILIKISQLINKNPKLLIRNLLLNYQTKHFNHRQDINIKQQLQRLKLIKICIQQRKKDVKIVRLPDKCKDKIRVNLHYKSYRKA